MFAIIFSIELFIYGIFNSIIFEPLTVIGSKKRTKLYISENFFILIFAVLIVILFSLLFWLVSLLFNLNDIQKGLLSILIFTPPFLLQMFTRRVFYLLDVPYFAAIFSLTYFLTINIPLMFINFSDQLSIFNIFLLLTIGSFISAFGGVLLLSTKIDFKLKSIKNRMKSTFRENINYGKWIFFSQIFQILPRTAIMPLLGAFGGLNYAGIFRIAQNYTQPLSQYLTSFNMVFLPKMSKTYEFEGKKSLKEFYFKYLKFNFISSIVYLVAILSLFNIITELVFPEIDIDIIKFPFYLFLLVEFLFLFIRTGVPILQAIEKPELIFRIYFFSAILWLIICIPLIITLKVNGAIISLICIVIFQNSILMYYLIKKINIQFKVKDEVYSKNQNRKSFK